jgi:hypothetical protein
VSGGGPSSSVIVPTPTSSEMSPPTGLESTTLRLSADSSRSSSTVSTSNTADVSPAGIVTWSIRSTKSSSLVAVSG